MERTTAAIYKTARGMEAAGKALNAYDQANRTLNVLSQSEKGINALLAANGITQAATGRDLFGKQLTKEEQQNSLLQGVFMMNLFTRKLAISPAQKAIVHEQGQAFKEHVTKIVHNTKASVSSSKRKSAMAGVPNDFAKVSNGSEDVVKTHRSVKVDGSGNIGEKSVADAERNQEHKAPLVNVRRLDIIEVRFKRNEKHDPEEFARQLRNQERGMNELTVEEYLANRERYIAEGRAIEANAAQQAAREEAYTQKLNELQRNGLSFSRAKKAAKEWLNTQAVLHNPDQIAGGMADKIGGMGDKEVNSSIGSQWKYRIDVVDEHIKEMARSMTTEQLKNTYLNVKLTH